MKIIFIASRFHGGGAQKVFLNIINHLSKNSNFEIILILFKSKVDDSYLESIDKNSKIIVLNSSAKFGWFKLVPVLKRENPDFIFSTLNYINVSTTLAVLISGINSKLIVREASDIMRTRPVLRKLQKFLYKRRVNLAWAITQNIAENYENILGLPNNKIFLAPNPLFVDSVKINSTHFEVGNPIRLLYCGRLTKLKRVDLILEGLALIKIKKWVFTIVGKGEEEFALKKQALDLKIEDQVKFVGYSSTPLEYMLKSDIFLLASKWEGFPNVVTEALYCANLCIAHDTRGGGIRYIKQLIPSVDIIDFLDAHSIAQKIDYYMDNHHELMEKKQLAHESAQQLRIENFYFNYFKRMLE